MTQYKLVAPLLISLCLIVPLTQASKFQYCDKNKDYAVKVTGVKISPNPVKGGKPATFTISATTNEKITGGILRVSVRYFGLPVYSEDHDLCVETSCPVTGGNFVVSHSQELPGFTPHMTIDSELVPLCTNVGGGNKYDVVVIVEGTTTYLVQNDWFTDEN
ncbi:unnamed protein product [Dovyalis caffra]|uniref:MD-2-related lipid-recognition domain-containing protein n=1 Tax=Dovyalis caffra TaxID=77055 RepID=A0AAV1RYW1_9ROSI|nr:unnamed protein product [Dovyalis caffra]